MATQDSTNPAQTNILHDSDRVLLCLQATYELDKIARILPSTVPLNEDQIHYAVKALAGRMLRLTSALLDGLGDDGVTTEEIRKIVHFDEGVGQG